MERYAWKAAVLPGKMAEYRRRHDEIWPEMLEMFRRAGIRNYSIWQTGDTLFGYYECDDLKTALAVQKDVPVSARWRAYMRDVIRMEQDPKSGAQPHLERCSSLAAAESAFAMLPSQCSDQFKRAKDGWRY